MKLSRRGFLAGLVGAAAMTSVNKKEAVNVSVASGHTDQRTGDGMHYHQYSGKYGYPYEREYK